MSKTKLDTNRPCQGIDCTNKAIGYKWCEECKKISIRKTNIKTNKKRTAAKTTLCEECNIMFTSTKYCRRCSQLVSLERMRRYRDNAAIVRPPKSKILPESTIDSRWTKPRGSKRS